MAFSQEMSFGIRSGQNDCSGTEDDRIPSTSIACFAILDGFLSSPLPVPPAGFRHSSVSGGPSSIRLGCDLHSISPEGDRTTSPAGPNAVVSHLPEPDGKEKACRTI